MKLAKALLLGFGVSLMACQSLATKDSLLRLQESIDGYNHAYRWKNYARAAAYLPNDLRAAFIATYEEDDKSLHVESYQVLKIHMEGKNAAKVTVRVRYMLLPSVTVENRTVTQHWAKVEEKWLIEAEDNSIRDVDPEAIPGNAEEAFGGEVDPSKKGKTEVEVTGPDGKTLRGKKAPAAAPEKESEK